VLLVAAGVVVAVAIPFGRGAGPGGVAAESGAATSLATVARRSLSSQTLVTGTLGYAGSSTIVVPAGTAPADLQKAQQTVASAEAALQAAQATLAADLGTLAEAQAKLVADRRKLASDCAGTNAAGSRSNGSNDNNAAASPCATAAQAVTTDEQAVTAAEPKVTTDRGSVASAQVALSAARTSLTTAASSAVAYETSATYTMLPSPGSVVRRGRSLYAIAGQPVLLLYGRVTAWRAFRAGMTSGPDVAELNANLRALGHGGLLAGDSFSGATARAISALQAAHGLAQTGELALGSVVFKPGPVRVKSVTPTVGAAVQAGPVLGVTSTRHQVTIALDAAHQSEVKVGDKVTITLPDNSTTPGVVSAVGSVATPGTQGAPATIEVHVKLGNQAAAGDLVQAPVNVSITTASVDNALVVPVNALLALAGGGYAVEEVGAGGVRQLVAVDLGLFDDSEGLVQVSGSGLHAGQRIVVPGS
jgi:peptidoglycan hydrolase-like protein with peptidoglycan-binding domain